MLDSHSHGQVVCNNILFRLFRFKGESKGPLSYHCFRVHISIHVTAFLAFYTRIYCHYIYDDAFEKNQHPPEMPYLLQ